MNNNISLMLCLLLTIAVLSNTQSPEGHCRTPDNQNGICVPLQSCNSLYQMYNKNAIFPEELTFLLNSKCGSGKTDVCCADAAAPTPTTRSSTSTTQASTSTTQASTSTTEASTSTTQASTSTTQASTSTTQASTSTTQASTSTTQASTSTTQASTSTTERSTSSTPTLITTLSTVPRISVRKCNEYKEFAYDKIYTQTIFNGLRITKHSNCAFTSVALILGGEPAKRREFPHMALIGYDNIGTIEWTCGGTLISEEFVLSAAHCSTHPRLGPAKFVRLGEHILGVTNDASHIDFNITERISHPEYRFTSHYNDIVLFKLDRKVEFNDAIRPACLPEQINIPTMAVASGWGNVEYAGRSSDFLLKVKLEIFSQNDCSNSYGHKRNDPSLNKGIVEETMLCAGSHNDVKDTCQGDSGGPLQILHETHHCTYIIIGVTSFGAACGFAPGVYTRVYSYLNWIESVVWPNE